MAGHDETESVAEECSIMNRAVFFDRDGTLIVDKDYLHRPEEVELFPGVPAALKRLQDAGFKLFIVTNQSGVGRGYFALADVDVVHRHIEGLLEKAGVHFQRIYVAPEAPGEPSRGRKPSPAFVWDARDEFGVDLGGSYMVGDKWIDLECGWKAGVGQCLLVRTGYGAATEKQRGTDLGRARVLDDVVGAADFILGEGRAQ